VRAERRPGEEDASRRERVFRRDAYRCAYCGEIFEPRLLTVDHVEPRMRGGDHSDGNLVTACQPCNAAKGAAPAWLYLADRPVERENFLLHAEHVWPRLRRAIEEAAARPPRRRGKR
jgi:hypothetical protein